MDDEVDEAGDEPRVGEQRLTLKSDAQVNLNEEAVPSPPRSSDRDYSRAGKPVRLWDLRVTPGLPSR